MASIEDIVRLRLRIAEPDETTYTDEQLGVYLDTYSTTLYPLDQAAYVIWTEKAASFAGLVDISEGGSSRKNSDLFKNATAMAAFFANEIAANTALSRRTVIMKLVRG